VTIADGLPLGEVGWAAAAVHPRGSATDPDAAEPVSYSVVDDDFFTTLGVPVLAGRTFDSRDTRQAPDTIIVNRTLAQRYWPGRDAVGQQALLGDGARTANVIGVVADGKYTSLDEPPLPFFYVTRRQRSLQNGIAVIVRTRGDAAAFTVPLERSLRAIDPALEFRTFTLADEIRFSLFVPNFTLMSVAGFGALVQLLAVVGLYGTVVHSVAQRRHEIGVRVALGARPRDIIRLVTGRVVWLTAAGAGVGLAAGLMARPVVTSLFFGVGAVEPVVWAGVVTTTMALALGTAYAAARPFTRAAAIDLMRGTR
jgi:hypothetical protein